jgi:iron complex outermembrane receptor protein
MTKRLFYNLFSKRNIVAFAALFWGYIAFAQSDCNIVLSGRIVDLEKGRPLQFSTIQEKSGAFESVADKDGNFRIDNICPGTYAIHFKHLICEHLDINLTLHRDTFIFIELPHVNHNLSTVIVTGGRDKFLSRDIRLGRNEIESLHGMNIGTMMSELNGINSLNSGGTVSKPMINGLYGYRTLIINNGVRQEGQNWGQEHAPEIDPYIARDIELLRGASALRYGPEALGGVVLVNPASVFNYIQDSISGSVHFAGQSNGRGGIVSGQLGSRFFTKVPVYWRLQGTLRQQGNLRSPEYFLDNTGYREQNFSWTAGTHFKKFTTDFFYSRFGTQFGIYSGAHIGNATDLKNVINGITPPPDNGFTYFLKSPRQEALHDLFKARVFYKLNNNQIIKFIAARQYNERQEFDLHLASGNEPDFDYKITTHTADLVWEKEGVKHFSHQIGANFIYQANTIRGRFFIPNFENKGAGLFYFFSKEHEKWVWSATARMDYRNLTAYYYITPDSLHTPNRKYLGVAAAATAEYHASENAKFVVNLSRNWRNPMPNELFSDGIHHGVATYEEGNPNLNQEIAHKVEVDGLMVLHRKWKLNIGLYAQYVKDFINLIPGQEPKQTIRGAFPFFYYDQTDAFFRGFNFTTSYNVNEAMRIESKASFLWADDMSRNLVLPQMPPFTIDLKPFFRNKNMEFGLSGLYVFEQKRYTPLSDFAPPPPGYFLLGAMFTYDFNLKQLPAKLIVRGENLTHQQYRDYLDRFRYFAYRPGINITFGFNVMF